MRILCNLMLNFSKTYGKMTILVSQNLYIMQI